MEKSFVPSRKTWGQKSAEGPSDSGENPGSEEF